MPRSTSPTDQAPLPGGPYSQHARIGGTVMAAGQVGLRPDGALAEGVAAQTEQALRNVFAVLAAGGAAETDILGVRVFLTDQAHFDEMNAVYESMFSVPYPARTTVYVGLPAGLLVEIDATAVVEAGS